MPLNKRKFKRSLITGISGSGGSYLSEYILENHPSTKVYGTFRNFNKINLREIKNRVNLIKCDLTNFKKIKKVLKTIKPDVIFHLASNADVKMSFLKPYEIINNNNILTINLL